jgi:alkylated DNA nucleotide flippase Atl1
MKKSWREKLADAKDLPKTMVIPSPAEVDAVMRRVPRGRLATIAEVRAALARSHGTDIACPMTTGIFAWIAANAAEEARAAGTKRVTPWWRTLKSGGELNPKNPGGVAAQQRLLEAEGHKVTRRGRRWLVLDFERRLARL